MRVISQFFSSHDLACLPVLKSFARNFGQLSGYGGTLEVTDCQHGEQIGSGWGTHQQWPHVSRGESTCVAAARQ